MNTYILNFELKNFNKLDEKFALLACQDYNYWNANDWFWSFRWGLFWFYSRIYGVKIHYDSVHAWLPIPRNSTEYELSSILFNMDSAIECLVFALNSLWNIKDTRFFYDISDENQLRKINPNNIIWVKSLPWYTSIFSETQSFWKENKSLINIITELHDVSKHRETIYQGWLSRLDAPKGFYEQLGIYDEIHKHKFWPMAEIILIEEPKKHRINRLSWKISPSKNLLLEEIAIEFCNFINKSGELILKDIENSIELKYTEFQ